MKIIIKPHTLKLLLCLSVSKTAANLKKNRVGEKCNEKEDFIYMFLI